MKVSDEAKQSFENVLKLKPNNDPDSLESVAFGLSKIKVNSETDGANILLAIDMLLELQQRREETRWREIAKEGLPAEDGYYLFTNGRSIDRIPLNSNTRSSKFIWRHVTHWCHERTDLPAPNNAPLPSIDDVTGICNLPATGDKYVRHLRDGGTIHDLSEVSE